MDSDLDGVEDFADDCPSIVNPGQEDKDPDGLGDACDAEPTTPNPGLDGKWRNATAWDQDGDGIINQAPAGALGDNCPIAPDPNQLDADGDGIGDACQTTAPTERQFPSADAQPQLGPSAGLLPLLLVLIGLGLASRARVRR